MSEIDSDTRLSIIREICRKEGHGELMDVTTFPGHPSYRRELLCQRGCGIAIFEFVQSATLDEMNAYLVSKGVYGIVRLRGTVEVER